MLLFVKVQIKPSIIVEKSVFDEEIGEYEF